MFLSDRNRSQRLARGAAWTVSVSQKPDDPQEVAAMVLAGEVLAVATAKGRLALFSAADGRRLAERGVPPPTWDGMAAAQGRLYVSTNAGDLACLGGRAR